jgi:hypothetical protein
MDIQGGGHRLSQGIKLRARREDTTGHDEEFSSIQFVVVIVVTRRDRRVITT